MSIFSQTTQYALYALTYLGQQEPGRYVMARTIAEHEDVPANYLAKVLQALARAGVVDSVRGPSGGFRLARALDEITLFEIRALFEGPWSKRACVLGRKLCSEADACVAHHNWQHIVNAMKLYLIRTTVAEIVAPLGEGGPGLGSIVPSVPGESEGGPSSAEIEAAIETFDLAAAKD